jgi:hypothetical protein
MRSDFCAFILTHGRPDNVKTYSLLRKCGYTGQIFIVIDNEDSKANEYFEKYKDEVIMFNKPFIANTFDTCDNQQNRKTIVYARNACFELAKELGYKYFIELDDDYYYFGMRQPNESACYIYDLDKVFSLCIEYLETSPITTIAFAQGGDHIGGFDGDIMVKPTCTKLGVKQLVLRCTRCNEPLASRAEIIPALGHDWDEPEYTWSDDFSVVIAERICSRDYTTSQK